MQNLSIDEKEYAIYLDKWLDGIKSELSYWKYRFETRYGGGKNWDNLISNDRPFNLDEYLTSEETKFLDVGSGPFSSCGIKTSKTKLKIYAVDPLAYIYKALKDKNKIYTGITPDFCMVECLDKKFQMNEFRVYP